MRGRRAAGFVLAVITLAQPARAQHPVAGPDSLHPRIKYADSLVSLNHECMVSKRRLSDRIRPVYVNGRPVGFC